MIDKRLKIDPFLMSSTLLIICLILSITLFSRAFMMGSAVGLLFLLIAYKKIMVDKRTIIFIILFLLFALIALSLLVKSDSTLGRLLIYKISYNMFLENPITGIGWDNFKRDYGLHQALYFRIGTYTTKEFLLAGNGYYAFNDYWQFIVETGLIGGVALIVFFSLIFKITSRRLNDNPNDSYLILSTAVIIILCTAALFTHVFAHKAFRITGLFAVFYIIFPVQSFSIKNSLKFLVVLSAITILGITQYFNGIKNFRNLKRLEDVSVLSNTGYILESQKVYEELFPVMKNDISFLREYSEVLNGKNNLIKKLKILKEIKSRWTDNLLYMNLGKVYEELNLLKDAELAYLQAVFIVPNRFVPREALYNFYIKTNNQKKAIYWRKIILLMPVKIPSTRVERIKDNIRRRKI